MLLKPYRVIDLTQSEGTLCAQILGDLGADVIQVEPPGGASGRSQGPFFHGINDREHSLTWWSYSRGKRSIELDIDADRETFMKLIASADFIIESEPVGSLAQRNLSYNSLASVNPGLIHVSMTPFGVDGPKANWVATDLTLMASAGPLAITGDSDRPPVRVSVPQAWAHAAAEAATGAMAALYERNQSGCGQHVVVSAQQALTAATQGYILSAAVNDEVPKRIAGGAISGELRVQLTFPAKDGHVSITLLFGATIGPATGRLMAVVCEEGFCDEATRDKDWLSYGLLLAEGDEPISEWERVKGCVVAWTSSKTKEELLTAAMARRLLIAPMTTIADVVNSEQFESRNFFQKPTGEGAAASINYPGAFANFSATPLAIQRRPPSLGEHTQEILNELKQAPLRENQSAPNSSGKPALAGLKVLDLMWALAGPGATRSMADCGADVIRIESSTRLDVTRTLRPFVDGDQSPEQSAIFHSTNAGKKMVTVDLTKPEGREIVLDLIKWADVVCESFSPRAMKQFGLDYETLRSVNPDIIMLSTCLMGQTGPLAMFAGYGNLAAAIVGFYSITGWPDRDPAGPFGAYTDYIAPRYNMVAVLAAVDHHRRTGEGQHIDLAQSEASMHFLTSALLDYGANGNVQERLGNRDPSMAPHGVYPCVGDDVHIAITCADEVQWLNLVGVIPELERPEFNTLENRLNNQDKLDEAMCAFTQLQPVLALEAQLQAAGVAASEVKNSPELTVDAQLQHLEHFITLPHQEGGTTVIESGRFHLSRSPRFIDKDAPIFNRDITYVLNDVLGYDDEKFGQLLVAGVLE